MKTSKFFLSTLIAASAMTATAYADLSTYDSTNNTINWVSGQANAFKYNTDGTWTIGTVSADGSISWSSDSASGVSRVNDTGWIAYFDETNQTISAETTSDSSDGGGIIVTGTGNTVTASVGRWAGSIQVDAGNTLNTSWSTQLKDGLIIANGTVNVTGGDLNFDGAGVRTWYTGDNGQINLQSATGVSGGGSISVTGSGTVAFSALTSIASGSYIEAAGSTITFDSQTISGSGLLKLASGSIQNVTLGSGLGLAVASGNTGTLSAVTFASGSTLDLSGVTLSAETAALTNSGAITFEEGSMVDLGKIVSGTTYKIFSDSATVTGWENLDAGSFSFELEEGTMAIRDGGGITLSNGTFTVATGTAGNLVWAGTADNATWNSSATNWLNNGSADKFYTGDNVTFGADAENKTVSFESGAELAVGTATIESGTSYTFADPVSLSGTSFTVGKNATLVLSSNAGPARYNFDFDNSVTLEEGATVELAGWAGKLGFNKLVMKNNSSLLFKNGNGTGGEIGSASSQIVVDAAQGVVTIAGSSYGNSSNVMGGISGIGTVKFGAHGGTNEYTISATIKDGETDGDKLAVDVALNSGQTVNLTGTNTYSGGTTITSGTLKLGSRDALGHGGATVKSNGTLDFNGNNFGDGTVVGYGDAITLSGGSIVNNGSSVGTNQRQLASVTLTADSYVGGSGNFGIISSGWGNSTLTLNGHTLTKNGDNDFWLTGTDVSDGVIDVQSGKLVLINGANNNNFSMDANAKIKLGVSGKLHALGVQNEAAGTGTKISLGSVEIVMTDESKSTARLTNQDSTFVVADSAKLYLDVTDLTLNGTEDVSLTIAGANAISSESFFDQVLVGSYDEQGAWVSSEWYYLANSWNSETGTLTLTIPEPSAFGLLAGVGALALVASRRRRSRR